MTIVISGSSPKPYHLAISANPVKVFMCFTMLNRSLGSSPLSGTLNFSLWIAEVLALEQEVSSIGGHKIKIETKTLTVAELASLFVTSISGHLVVKLRKKLTSRL